VSGREERLIAKVLPALALKGLSGDIRERALKGREKVSAELPPEQVATVEQMVQNWKPKAP